MTRRSGLPSSSAGCLTASKRFREALMESLPSEGGTLVLASANWCACVARF